MSLGDKIAELRRQRGWSQENLAERLGVTRQSVSKWESGASVPDLDKIIGLSELFGVTTDYLLGREDLQVLDVSGLTAQQVAHLQMLVEDLRGS